MANIARREIILLILSEGLYSLYQVAEIFQQVSIVTWLIQQNTIFCQFAQIVQGKLITTLRMQQNKILYQLAQVSREISIRIEQNLIYYQLDKSSQSVDSW